MPPDLDPHFQSTGFDKFASIFHAWVTFSTTIQCRFIIHFVLDPHIYHGVYMSVRHMSSNIDLIFMIYRFYKIYIKFSLWSHFLHPLQLRFTMFGPNIYHGRYLSDLHVSPIFDLIFSLPVLLNMIRSVSPLHVPYHLGSPCPSPHFQSADFVKFMLSFAD